ADLPVLKDLDRGLPLVYSLGVEDFFKDLVSIPVLFLFVSFPGSTDEEKNKDNNEDDDEDDVNEEEDDEEKVLIKKRMLINKMKKNQMTMIRALILPTSVMKE
nr:hypothetical protein [Tanacetum cinerariifolium]